MTFTFDSRLSDSPLVEAIWSTRSVGGGSFVSSAACNLEMVVTKQRDQIRLTVRGPETKASLAPIPVDAEFFGIIFKLGTFLPTLPAPMLVDEQIHLPEAADKTFWLCGSAWEFPTFENADTFIARLVREGLLAREPLVDAALQGQLQPTALSPRTLQRRFIQATGLSQQVVAQIERARRAMTLLEQGTSILDTVERAGYADQPHLTRALKHYVGQTPAQIAAQIAIR